MQQREHYDTFRAMVILTSFVIGRTSMRRETKNKTIERRTAIQALGASVVAANAFSAGSARAGNCAQRTIDRDVCIIGGGSSGSYTAVRLRDQGVSVAVLERESRLGGHAQTYVDPVSGVPINTGVVVLENVSIVTDYLNRFGIQAAPASFSGGQTAYIDFVTGKVADGFTPPAQDAFIGALLLYRQILATEYPYLDDGFYLPNPVPEELIRPFSEFIANRGLEALFPTAFQFGQGLGRVLENPAIYALKNFSAAVVDSILGTGFLILPSGVAELYDQIAAELADDVLCDAIVQNVDRSRSDRIEVSAETPDGEVTIRCKKLVVACPPNLKRLSFMDTDETEREVLEKFRANHYSTGVVELTGVPADLSMQNVGADTLYNLPSLPGIYGMTPTGAPGLWNVKFGSSSLLNEAQVRNAIRASIRRVRSAGTYPVHLIGLRTFSNHSPFTLMVDECDLRNGFYEKLYALQGRRRTFYTGAAFQTHDSSLIWRFTESLLPRITA
jgi:Flavin containing amine oxidoreductase